MQHYFNTTTLTPLERDLAARSARTQNEAILQCFLDSPNNAPRQSASEVWKRARFNGYLAQNVPLTSVRRGLCSLVRAGKLVKLTDTTTGIYGKPEYLFTLAR